MAKKEENHIGGIQMLKKKDMKIFSVLRKNARESLKNISKQTKIPISTIYDRLKEHEKTIIHKYTALLDFSKFGYTTRAHILVNVPKEKRQEMQDFLTKHININSVYKINNRFDYLIEAIFTNIQEIEDFIESLEMTFWVTDKEVHYIIRDIAREKFMENPELIDMV
jgi:DNA-binding Lrp family transcriptional regulator